MATKLMYSIGIHIICCYGLQLLCRSAIDVAHWYRKAVISPAPIAENRPITSSCSLVGQTLGPLPTSPHHRRAEVPPPLPSRARATATKSSHACPITAAATAFTLKASSSDLRILLSMTDVVNF
jgi:hypothetical protein